MRCTFVGIALPRLITFGIITCGLALFGSSCLIIRGAPRSAVNMCASVPVSSTAVTEVYSNGKNWNDYVKNAGGTSIFTRTNVACAGTEAGYFACLHGGELRKVIATGQTSCTGLSAADQLGAFDWVCDPTQNPVVFYSKGLKVGKGLRDLVGANAFLANSVSIYKSGCPIVASPASTSWWSNTVGPLPVNRLSTDNPLTLTNVGQIYTLSSSDSTSGYDVYGVDKVSVVTLGSAVLSFSGFTNDWCDDATGSIIITGYSNANAVYRSILCGGNAAKFGWYEGKFSGKSGTNQTELVAYFITSVFNRFHNSEFTDATAPGASDEGIHLEWNTAGTSSNLVDYSYAYNNSGPGFYLYNTLNNTILNSGSFNNGTNGFVIGNIGSGNRLINSVAANNGGEGVNINTTESNNFVVNLLSISNAVYGLFLVPSASQNTIHDVTLANNTNALTVDAVSPNNTFNNIVALNGTTGINVNNSNANQFSDVLSAYQSSKGIFIGSGTAANNNTFYGNIWVGNNTANCTINLGAGNLLNAACQHAAGLAIASVAAPNSNTSWVGKLSVNDSVNSTAQVAATAVYASTNDWINFESPYRGWGKNGVGALFSATQLGRCSAASCLIYDFRPNLADVLIHGNYGTFVNGAACPTSTDATQVDPAFPGNVANVITDQQASPNKFLKAAVEVMDPYLNPNGNFDGLCESNEACIFTPNLGAYQGSGDYSGNTCIWTGSIPNGVVNVTMYGYSSSTSGI